MAALNGNDADLATAFSDQDYEDVAVQDGDRVDLAGSASEYLVFLFKDKHDQQEAFSRTWIGRSNLAPSSSTIYLQIYNRTTEEWQTLDSNDSAAADEDVTLTGGKSTDLGDYFDGSFEIACRVYQEIS